MAKLKIENGDWVLVCDGRKAIILENIGDHVYPNLRVREEREHENPPTHMQGLQSPGRVFQSLDHRRSSVEQTDLHEESERIFLTKVAKELDGAVGSGMCRGLIVVAPPPALGHLRQAYGPALRQSLKAEIDKDYVKMPIYDIESLLLRHVV